MKIKILSLLLLAVNSLTACASKELPLEKPYYVYILLYGGGARGYPMVNPSLPEINTTPDKLIGSMCLSIDDWEARQLYMADLKNKCEGN